MLYEKYRHSASSGNTFLADLPAFVFRWGFRQWGETNPRMAMGTAAEKAAQEGLLFNLSDYAIARIAKRVFDTEMQGEVQDDGTHFPERGYAMRIAIRMTRELRKFGKLVSYQPWRTVRVAGVDREITIKPDFLFEDCIVDTKATLRLPGDLGKWPDVRQQGLYASAHRKAVILMYVSPGKTWANQKRTRKNRNVKLVPLNRQEIVTGASELLDAFERIEGWDQAFPDPIEAWRLLTPDRESFRWDEQSIEQWKQLAA